MRRGRKSRHRRDNTLLNLLKKQLQYESWKRGTEEQGAVESNRNIKQTLALKYSPASNRCHIWSCEQVCLTTTPAAWPTNLTTFSSLGASAGSSEQSHSPLCAQKTQFETQLVSRSTPCLSFTQLCSVFQTVHSLSLHLCSVYLSNWSLPPASLPCKVKLAPGYACHLKRCHHNRNLSSDLSLESTPLCNIY